MISELKVITRWDALQNVDFEAGAVLLVDKPPGMTSFGVVARLRRMTGVRRIGHAGTLDPSATGLLILMTGKATRSQAQFMGLDKEYLAGILLGVETDTWDLDGHVIRQNDRPRRGRQECLSSPDTEEVRHSCLTLEHITREQVRDLLSTQFTGEIEQRPPAFSALKVGGVPSYRLARKGRAVELKIRLVTVHSINLETWSPPDITLRVACSSGFYVRSLAHDLGQELGCGAALKSLVRTRIGAYRLDEAYKLDELEGSLSAIRTAGHGIRPDQDIRG